VQFQKKAIPQNLVTIGQLVFCRLCQRLWKLSCGIRWLFLLIISASWIGFNLVFDQSMVQQLLCLRERVIFNLVVIVKRKLMTVLLLLDFSKALDNVHHSLLCSKLSSFFRFQGTAVELIRSYLNDRYQSVYVDGKISDLVLVARGVVQGSVIGLLLFSLFINDIASRMSHCRYHFYADDAQLSIDSISDCMNRMNLNLKSLHKWTI
jgi:hypothetical protein